MAIKEAGIRLTLQGESAYLAGLKRISSEMKSMSLQGQLALAKLGGNAKQSDIFKATAKNLADQLTVSEKKTKSLQDAQDKYQKSLLPLKSAISETTAKHQEAIQKSESLKQRYEELVQTEGKRSKATREAKSAYESSKKEIHSMAKEIKDLNVTYDDNVNKLQKLPTEITKSELATQKLRNEVSQLNSEYKRLGGNRMDSIQKWHDIGKHLKDKGLKNLQIGSTLTNQITMPILSGYKTALIAAGEFNTEVGRLGPLLSGGKAITSEVRQEMVALGESSRQWAIDYGKSTSEINSGMAELIRNGYNSSQVMGMIPSVLDASIASGEGFGTVMTTTSQVLSQFNLRGKDTNTTLNNTQRVVDSLTYVANATSSGFNDLGEGMSYVGPVANSLNMTVEETASVLGILSDKGIEASKGGTALRGILTQLLDPSKESAKAMAEMGFSAEEFKKGTLKLPDIIDRISKNTKGWTDQQRGAAIATAFGTQAQSAMNALVAAGGDELRKLTKEAEGASGATKQIANSMKELPEFKYQQLMAQVKDLGIELGSELLPVAMDVMEAIKDVVQWFSNLDEGTKKLIVQIGLFSAAIGPLYTLMGAGQSVMGATSTIIGNLIKSFSKTDDILKTADALDDVVISAGKAGSAAALFSNPWVLAGGAAIGAVAGFVWYMNNEAQAPFAAHNESVKETEGAYQEWFEAIVSGAETIDSFNNSAKTNADETTENYKKNVEEVMQLNREVQDLQSRLWSNKNGWENAGYHNYELIKVDDTTYRYAFDDLRKKMAELGQEDAFDTIIPKIKNYTTTLGNAFSNTISQFNEHKGITENWANAQISAISRVTKDVISNYEEQKQADLNAIEVKRQNLNKSQSWYDAEVAKLNASYAQKQQIVRDAEANINGILREASETGRVLKEEEVLSMMKSYQQLSESAGQSLSTIPEAMNLIGDNLNLFVSRFGLGLLKSAGLIDDATLQIIAGLDTTEERTNALKKALEGVGNIHVAPEVKVDGLPQAIESIEQYNGLSIQDKIASLSALGTEDIVMMLEKLGLWQQLSPERKEVITNAIGLEQVEEVMWALNGYNAFTPEEKEIIMQTQTAQLGLSDLITQSDLWNNTDFKSELININTTGPQAEAEIINLINKYRETQGLEPITVEATTVGVSGATAEMQGFGAASVGIQDKSATVTTDVLSMALNTLAIIAYNAASGAMTDKTSTATTLTPSILSNTLSGWNWIGMLNNTYSKSSTLTTYVDRVYRTFGKHATGGHIGMFAQGGNISKWGGMFADGGNVPSGYAGIVGEAGPEIFQVTKHGVSITPLNTREKMRGIKGVLEDLNGSNNGGQQINVSVQVSDIVIRDDRDIDSLATLIGEKISKNIQRDRIMRKGTSVGHVV